MMIYETNENNIETFIKKIENKEIVIFPTDTVYGIGCDATNTESIEKIYELKKRAKNKSLLINVADMKQIKEIAKVNEIEEYFIKKFMPGTLSIILKIKYPTILSKYTIKEEEIGIRIPGSKTLQQILKKLKTPLISTSCNKSNEPACIKAKEANKIFPQLNILENDEEVKGISSTIIKIQEKEIIIIREGAITKNMIENMLKTSKYKEYQIKYLQ